MTLLDVGDALLEREPPDFERALGCFEAAQERLDTDSPGDLRASLALRVSLCRAETSERGLEVWLGADPDAPRVAIVALRAELGARDGREATGPLIAALREVELDAVLLDLADLEHVSGGGLALIARLDRDCARRGMMLVVARANGAVTSLIESLGGTWRCLRVMRDFEAARRAVLGDR